MKKEQVKAQCREWFDTFKKLYELSVPEVMSKEGKYYGNLLAFDAVEFFDKGGYGKEIKLSLYGDDYEVSVPILTVYNDNDDVFKLLYGKIISYYLMKNYPSDHRIDMSIKTWNWSLSNEIENKKKASPVVLRLFNVTYNNPEYKRIFMSEIGCHNSGSIFPINAMINDLYSEIKSDEVVNDSINVSIKYMEKVIEIFEIVKAKKRA